MPHYNCIYALNKKSPIEAWNEEAGVRVRLTIGNPQLRVDDVTAASPEEAFASARDIAERFLDGVSRDYQDADLAIISDEMDVEVLDDQGKVTGHAIDVVVTATTSVGVHVVEKDASGNVIHEYDSFRPGAISLASSDAPRYFRKARTSSDVFDKFRNYFYVLEHVASRLLAQSKPRPKGYGGRMGLVRFAVEKAFPDERERLRDTARMVPAINEAADVYEAVARFLLKRNRDELEHAQFQKRRKVPFRRIHEDAVKEALSLVETVARSLLAVEKAAFGL